MKFQIHLNYREVTALITTDWELYYDFINLYLKNFVSEPTEHPNLTIESTFPVTSDQLDSEISQTTSRMSTVGNWLWFDRGNVYRHRGNKKILARVDDLNYLKIRCEDRLRFSSRRGLKALIKKARDIYAPTPLSRIYHAFQEHMRLTFHFPLFWLLETHYGAHLLHGAAIRSGGSGVMIAGLAGVGKSTLASYLHFNVPGVEILTDNFLIYDKGRIYGFPEALRLSDDGLAIASAPPTLPNSFRLRNRIHWIPPQLDNVSAQPRRAYLLCLGEKLKADPVSSEFFVDTALGLNDLVREFHNYDYVGVFPFGTRHFADAYADRAKALKHCLKDVPCAILTIPKVRRLSEQHAEIVSTLGLETE